MVTAGWLTVAILGAIALAECLVWALVKWFRPKFQWLITRDDIAPEIDPELLKKYVNGSFDPELGWSPRAHSSGVDETSEVPRKYTIDGRTRRVNPGFEHRESAVSVFGDSFAFCRMVNDDETWPHFLSIDLDTNVQNYGVGNYGLDQAYLRFMREITRSNLKDCVVIFAFVPETISRIHSYWRHFYEYGNILAFKPRFLLKDSEIILCPQAVSNEKELSAYRDKLEYIKHHDLFYDRKILKDLNKFPFSSKLITRWRRLPELLWHLSIGEITGRRAHARRRAMDVVLRENAREAMRLYRDPDATDLLKGIAARIAETCREAGIVPLFLIMPQPVDIERGLVTTPGYRNCVAAMGAFVDILDLSEILVTDKSWRDLFTDGMRGPHFHKRGNRYVASAVKPVVERLLKRVNAEASRRAAESHGLASFGQ